MNCEYDLSDGRAIRISEPQIEEVGEVEFKEFPFQHPEYLEPELVMGTYIVRDRHTHEYVYMSDAPRYDRQIEFMEHDMIVEELGGYGIEEDDLEGDWEPVEGYEDQYESVFLDA